MNKKTLSWLVVGILVLVVLVAFAALPSLWIWSRGNSFHRGYGMMGGGYGMMSGGWMGMGFGFGWLIPALLLGLVIAAGVWAGNSLSQQNHTGQKNTCPHCAKRVEADWQTCPYCSTALSTND